jgi:tetratricopeptide (TPR) repeat protein
MGVFLNQAYEALCDRIISCNKADVSTLVREARKFREAGDFEQAQAIYRQILEANPKNPGAWTEFGSFLRSAGRYAEALTAYHQAEAAGAKAHIYGDIAVTLLYQREFDGAKQYLSRFLASNFNPAAAVPIARAFAFRDQAESAIEIFEKVAQKDKELETLAAGEIGNLYLRLGMPDKALTHFEGLVEKSPNGLMGVYNMGAALSRLSRESDATQWFLKAIALFERTKARGTLPGETASLLQMMSQAYAASGAVRRAIELLNEAIASVGTIPTVIFSSIQYRNISPQEFVEESRTLLATFKSRAPESSEAHKM